MSRDFSAVFSTVADWGPKTVAIAILSATDTIATYGPGDAVLEMASVTKPLTSYAIHAAAKAGLVSLDEPVPNDVSKGPITLTHLLAHASGLPADGRGVVLAPKRKRVYSNFGYDLAAQFVAERAGMPFADVLDAFVLSPLNMTQINLYGSAASEATGTVNDLMRFARELLHPTLIDADMLARATSITYPSLAGVMPGFGRHDPLSWGVGFEVFANKSPHWLDASLPANTFGHFGRLGGFLFVLPDDDVAVVSLSSEPFGQWAIDAWPPFSREVFRRVVAHRR